MDDNFEIIAEGLLFPEGPVACDDGSLLLVEINRGTLSRITDGRVEVVAELGGGPNGIAFGPDSMIYVCNNGGRFRFVERDGLVYPGPRPPEHAGGSIQRVDPKTGKWETLYDSCNGRRLHAPNDLVFDATGGFWFSDHGTGEGDGGLFHAQPDGSRITRWRDGLRSPNGVGLLPGETAVVVADTHLRRVTRIELEAPGRPKHHHGDADRNMVQLDEGQLLDSLAVEADGRVCVGTLINGGISECRADGSWTHHPCPDPMTTNICFGGADMRDAFLTFSATGRVARARWPRPGLRLNYQR